MENKFLQSFLKTGLFDIGDNDDRLEWLQQAIADLQKKFEEDYSLLPKYTLVALDPNISDEEPVLNDTEELVITYWKALRIKYPDMPRNIHRGVILNSLYSVGVDDPIAARIIYLTATNFFPYAKLNNEKKMVESLLSSLGEIAEKHAVEEWSLVEKEPTLKLGALKITDFKFGSPQVDTANLKRALKDSVLRTPEGYNPYQHPDQWGDSFATKAGGAISEVFQSALAGFSKSLSPTAIEAPLNKFFGDFKKALDANLKASFASLTAVERRSKLLWWKETLYSPSLRISYRGLDKNLLPIVMAADLNNQTPEITPASVDYLLMDTLFLLNDKNANRIKFSDYLVAISEEPVKSTLKLYFTNINEEAGRISITDFIALLVNDRVRLDEFQNKTGIESNREILVTELAVAVLHDLLTQRLLPE